MIDKTVDTGLPVVRDLSRLIMNRNYTGLRDCVETFRCTPAGAGGSLSRFPLRSRSPQIAIALENNTLSVFAQFFGRPKLGPGRNKLDSCLAYHFLVHLHA
jgi:hypothetical protein